MRIYYCDNCDRLIKVNEQTQDMFVDEFETAYCLECRESFCNSDHELEEIQNDSQFSAPIAFPAVKPRKPRSGFYRVPRRPKASGVRKASRRQRSPVSRRRSW